MESILAAEGFEQAERLARFLPTANSDDLRRLLLGMQSQGGYLEPTLSDAIFLRWMAIDAEGALAFTEKEGFVGPAWWAWGKVDPEAALAAALAKPGSWLGTMVVRAIAQDDPARAREILDQYPRFTNESAMAGMASGLMNVDPAAGATLAAAWHYSLDQENLVSGWARREPEAALAWARALPDQTRRAEALGIVLAQWAATHPEKVGPAIEALPDGRTKWKLYAEHAKSLAATDPDAARAWVDAAPTPLVRREAALELVRGLAAADPQAALAVFRDIDWSLGQESSANHHVVMPNGEVVTSGYGPDPLTRVAMELGKAVPEDVLAMVGTLPPEAPVSYLTHHAFGTWALHDPRAASEWLAAQPDGEVRALATRQLVDQLRNGPAPDFEAAAHWALTLPQDERTRKGGTLSEVVRQWRAREPEAAQAFLDSPACPPEIRSTIRASSPTP